MATVAKVRVVRCPKCLKLLTEFSDVHVYQCGACGAVLQAKNRKSITSGIPEPTSLSGNDSSDDVSCSSDVKHSSCDKGKFSDIGSHEIKQRHSDTHSTGFSSSDTSSSAQSLTYGASQPKTDYSSHEEAENSLMHINQVDNNFTLNMKMETSPESSAHSAASRKDMADTVHSDGHGNSLLSVTARSSITSSGDGSHDSLHAKYRRLSKRTSRRQIISASTDNKACKEREENTSGNPSLNTDAAQGPKSRDLSLKSSPDSEGFHSIQNWIESERDGPSRSLSGQSALNMDPSKYEDSTSSIKLNQLEENRIELLKQLDELRNQLGGLSVHREAAKPVSVQRDTDRIPPLFFNHNSKLLLHPTRAHQWSQQYQFSQVTQSCLNSHAEPNFHCNNTLCVAHSHNICCHSPKTNNPHQHVISNLPPSLHRARPARRHCLPVSGGAPFVICYKCSELLQIPADFLVSRKRLHKLQCGACSKVLALSFPARSLAKPQAAIEGDNVQEDPISYTEEYGLSVSKTCSTELKPVLQASRNSSEERGGKQVIGPPLHLLMGYHSARKLIYRFGDDDDDDDGGGGYESSEINGLFKEAIMWAEKK